MQQSYNYSCSNGSNCSGSRRFFARMKNYVQLFLRATALYFCTWFITSPFGLYFHYPSIRHGCVVLWFVVCVSPHVALV